MTCKYGEFGCYTWSPCAMCREDIEHERKMQKLRHERELREIRASVPVVPVPIGRVSPIALFLGGAAAMVASVLVSREEEKEELAKNREVEVPVTTNGKNGKSTKKLGKK